MRQGSVTFVGKSRERYHFQAWSLEARFNSVAAVYFVTKRAYDNGTYATLLNPRAGYTYDATARYADGIYHVVIRESGGRGSAGREIARRGLHECGRRG